MRIEMAACILCLAGFVVGCGERADTMATPARESIARCRQLVADVKMEAPANVRYEVFKKAFDQIAAVPDAGKKVELAKELSALVNEIDLELQGVDYKEFADRVSRFRTLLDWSVWSLFEARADGNDVLQCLMDGTAKYRKASFAIPVSARRAGESLEEYSARCEAIISLAGEYEHAMMTLDKAEWGHLQSLPPELHGKYHEWKKSMEKLPSAKDIQLQLRALR